MGDERQTDLKVLANCALAGDAISAAQAAAILNVTNVGAYESLSAAQLLTMAMGSKDPDFLVSLGGELLAGELFPRDEDLALRCYRLADTFSPFKGAYALGRSSYYVNPEAAKHFFWKAANKWHITSIMHLWQLSEPKSVLTRTIARSLAIPVVIVVVLALFVSKGAKEHFWRYTDVFPRGFQLVDEKIGKDRGSYFSAVRTLRSQQYLLESGHS